MIRAATSGAALLIAALVCGTSHAGTSGKPVGTFNGCPSNLKALPSNWHQASRRAANFFLLGTFAGWNKQRHWGLKLAGAEVGDPFLVRSWLPSGWIKKECGETVWRRSIGVTVTFPAMEFPNPKGPCNDCAHVVLLLGATSPSEWRIWGSY